MTIENDPPLTEQKDTMDSAGEEAVAFDDTSEFDETLDMGAGKKATSPVVKFGGVAIVALLLGGGGYYYVAQQNQPAPYTPMNAAQNTSAPAVPADLSVPQDMADAGMSSDMISGLPPQPEALDIASSDFAPPPAFDGGTASMEPGLSFPETSDVDADLSGLDENAADTAAVDALKDIEALAEQSMSTEPEALAPMVAPDTAGLTDAIDGTMGGQINPMPDIVMQGDTMDSLENSSDPFGAETQDLTAMNDTSSAQGGDAMDAELQKQLLESLMGAQQPPAVASADAPNGSAEMQNYSGGTANGQNAVNVTDATRALKEIEVAATIRPQPPKYYTLKQESPREAKNTRLAAAKRALKKGQNAKALTIFDSLLDEDSNETSFILGRGVALQRLSRYEDALAEYEKVLQRDPENLEVLTNVLGVLATQNPEYSMDKLERLHEKYPSHVGIMVQLALARSDSRQIGGAIDLLQQAQRIEPRNPSIAYNLGVMHDRAGDRVKAALFYRQALLFERETRDKGMIPIMAIKQRLSMFN